MAEVLDVQQCQSVLDSMPKDVKQLTPAQWQQIIAILGTLLTVFLGGGGQAKGANASAECCCACHRALRHCLEAAGELSRCCEMMGSPQQPATKDAQ